jgi:hypothetical protein
VERSMNMKCAKYGTWMKAKIISMVRKKEKTQARSNGKGFNGFQTKTKGIIKTMGINSIVF